MLNSFKHLVTKKSKEDTQIETYKEQLQRDPNNVNLRLKLGDLYAKSGDKKSAIQEYTAAAIQYADDGFLVKAIAVNKIIVRLEPERQEALDRLSDLYFQRGIVAEPMVQQYRNAQGGQEVPVEEEAPPTEEPDIAVEEIDLTVVQHEQPDLERYVSSVPLLAQLSPENRQWLAKQSQIHATHAKEYLLENAEEPESLFLILEGNVHIYTKDKEGQDSLLQQLTVGGFWGGMFLFAPMRQNQNASVIPPISVRMEQQGRVLEIPKATLTALIKRDTELSESLLLAYYQHKNADMVLARVPLFSHLEPVERAKIAEHFSPVSFRKGTTIISEGESGEEMFVIKTGQVGVYTTLVEEEGGVSVIKTDQERLHLATLGEGDFFGEQALLTNEPRSATIIAISDVHALKFTRHDLGMVIKQYPRVGALLQKYNQKRIADTLESLKAIW